MSAHLALIPWPVRLTTHEGSFVLPPGIPRAGEAFTTQWQTAFPGRGGATVELEPSLGTESYRLVVDKAGIRISAGDEAGAFYALQTLIQIENGGEVPFVEIEDAPRFGWRGMHLDVCRHFMPKDWVKKFLDQMARYRFNVLHWHLTEDQAWRIEIKKYPRLTEVGSKRRRTMLKLDPETWSEEPHEGFYSQDEIREIVAYAAERHIRVMPEIEMPGHASAAIVAYPELGVAPVPEVPGNWGVHTTVFNVEPGTFQFLEDVLIEVLDLFPSPWIHIGGDECPKDLWKTDPKIQAKIQELGLNDEHELQSWFIRHFDRWLTERGRRLVGWDEILEGGLAKGATVMSWRGVDGGIAAAQAGHDVVMTPWSHTYFDHYQSQDREQEPHAIGGFTPLEKVYEFEPIPEALTGDERNRVLGAQGQLWTEYMRTPDHVEYMAFPRLTALAEVLWTPASGRDFTHYRSRLQSHLRRWDAIGIRYRDPDKPTS